MKKLLETRLSETGTARRPWHRLADYWVAGATALMLAACGGGGGNSSAPPPPPTSYNVGGTVSGLTASGLVLANGSSTVTVASGATSFSLSGGLTANTAYAFTVQTQPKDLTCTVSNGSGTVGSADVTNVAVACVITPARFAYASWYSGWGESAIAAYTVDNSTGALTALGSPTTLPNINASRITSLSTGSSGKYLWAVSGRDIFQFSVGANGQLTPLTPATVDNSSVLDGRLERLTIDAAERFAYASIGGIADTILVYRIGSDGGLVLHSTTPRSAANSYPQSVVLNPAGTKAYVRYSGTSDLEYFSVQADGSLTPLGSPTGLLWPHGLTASDLVFDASGRYAYAGGYCEYGSCVWNFSVNSDGSLTPPAQLSGSTEVGAGRHVAVDPAGRAVYAVVDTYGVSSLRQYSLDSSTGALTPMVPASLAVIPWGPNTRLAIDPTGRYLYMSSSDPDDNCQIVGFSIGSSGALTPLATPGITVFNSCTEQMAFVR